jgi:hypothetical protein
MKYSVILSAIIGGLAVATQASAFTVDANLSDWGLDIKNGDWTPSTGIQATIEDQHGSGAYYLSPGWGGQAYDAEAIYAAIVGQTLYIALVTGHDPNTLNKPSANSYGAGDFAIDLGDNGSYELGIKVRAENGMVQGGVYGIPTWNYGLWNTSGNYDPAHPDSAHPTSLSSGTWLGSALLSYTSQSLVDLSSRKESHYFYEASLDLSLLQAVNWDGTSPFSVHWTENCANDSIEVDPGRLLPEPGSLALLGIGLAGLIGRRKKTG